MSSRGLLVGSFDYQLDSKNRIRLPNKLRGDEDQLYFTKGRDGCISAYFPDEFSKVVDKLRELRTSVPQARDEMREFVYSAILVDIDSQGRLVIPKNFIEMANIKQDILVCGAVTKLEIWAKEVYDNHFSKPTSNFDNIDIF